MYDTFISYSTRDNEAAQLFALALNSHGISYWFAPRNISSFGDWKTAILQGLSECKTLTLLFSSASNMSQHVEVEVDTAFHHNLPIFTVRLEDVIMSPRLSYAVTGLQIYNAVSGDLKAHFTSLSNYIANSILEEAKREDFNRVQQRPLGPSLLTIKDSALRALHSKNYSQALKLLEQILEQNPNDPKMQLAYGIAYSRGQRISQLTIQQARTMHRHFGIAFQTANFRPIAALALLLLKLDFYKKNGVNDPDPDVHVLLVELKIGRITHEELELVNHLNISKALRDQLNLG